MYNTNSLIQLTRGDTWFNIPALWMGNPLLYEEIKQMLNNEEYKVTRKIQLFIQNAGNSFRAVDCGTTIRALAQPELSF